MEAILKELAALQWNLENAYSFWYMQSWERVLKSCRKEHKGNLKLTSVVSKIIFMQGWKSDERIPARQQGKVICNASKNTSKNSSHSQNTNLTS